MKGVILCGGRGSRLSGLFVDTPKCMVPFGGLPLLEHQIINLRNCGVTELVLCVHHLGCKIRDYFGAGDKWGVTISYYEETQPMGTGGALAGLRDKIDLGQDFLVLYGDTLLSVDFERIINYHYSKSGLGTLAVHPNSHPFDSDIVELDETSRVVSILTKPHPPHRYYRNLVNAALYVFNSSIFNFIERGKVLDIARDILPLVLSSFKASNSFDPSWSLYGYRTPEYIKDVGTEDRYRHCVDDYLSGRVRSYDFRLPSRAIFLDRDGVISYDDGNNVSLESYCLLPHVAGAISKINSSGYLAIVVTNQAAIAKGRLTQGGLEHIHCKLETLLGIEGAWLDGIYFCPHHPQSGFCGEVPQLKTHCSCRKPSPGMLLRAASDFNIDLNNSYLVGDSVSDVLAAKACGVTPILVAKNQGTFLKQPLSSDAGFCCSEKSLLDAVNFILNK